MTRSTPRWRSRDTFSTIVIAIASFLVVLPVVGSPYTSDDVLNSRLPQILAKAHESRLSYITAINSVWMHDQGRFFPGAIGYMTYSFTTLTTRIAYKVWFAILLCAVLILVAVVTRRIIGSAPAALIAVGALASCWEFRYPIADDGLTSYVGLIPWTIVLMLAATLLLAATNRRWRIFSAVAGLVLWSLAVITYEYSVILVPAILVWLWIMVKERKWRWIVTAAVVLPSLFELFFSESLGSHISRAQGSEYALNLQVGPIVATTVKQLVSAIPLSEYWIKGAYTPVVHVDSGTWAIGAVLIVVVTVALLHKWRQTVVVGKRRVLAMLTTGGVFWLFPALLVGGTARWQQAVVWGQSYIPVVFETLGFSLVLTSLLCLLARPENSKSWRHFTWGTTVGFVLILAIGIAVGFTAVLNYSMVV